jgi:hypothetical protein
MQIVIDIPEEEYQNYLKMRPSYPEGVFCYIKAIQNGTPLPKGHGRLGDLDAIKTEMVNGIHAGNYEDGYEAFAHINNMDDCVDCVRYADTIIEADKE